MVPVRPQDRTNGRSVLPPNSRAHFSAAWDHPARHIKELPMTDAFVLADLVWEKGERRLTVRGRGRLDVLGGLLGVAVFAALAYGGYVGWQRLEAAWLRWACAAGGALCALLAAHMFRWLPGVLFFAASAYGCYVGWGHFEAALLRWACAAGGIVCALAAVYCLGMFAEVLLHKLSSFRLHHDPRRAPVLEFFVRPLVFDKEGDLVWAGSRKVGKVSDVGEIRAGYDVGMEPDPGTRHAAPGIAICFTGRPEELCIRTGGEPEDRAKAALLLGQFFGVPAFEGGKPL
jgi:hypothetical protein